MTEADTSTYEDFRQYVLDNYQYTKLIDDSGSTVTTIDIANDSRAQWLDGNTTNPMTLEIVVDGADGDVPQPTTFARTELYDTSSGDRKFSDPHTNATIEADGDTLTLAMDIEIPDV